MNCLSSVKILVGFLCIIIEPSITKSLQSLRRFRHKTLFKALPVSGWLTVEQRETWRGSRCCPGTALCRKY